MSGFLGMWFGVWGTCSTSCCWLSWQSCWRPCSGRTCAESSLLNGHGRPRVAGTLILWLGTFLAAMAVTMLVSYFFPQEVLGAGQGVQDIVVSIPVLLALFLVALTPAVCEELAFRGGFLGCLRGMKSKWAGILIVAVCSAPSHGSVWRMIPTAILGVALGYLLVETDNLFYSMLFHLSTMRCLCCSWGFCPSCRCRRARGT